MQHLYCLNRTPAKEHPEWQSYFMSPEGAVIAPYYHLSNDYKTSQSFKLNLKQVECDNFFNHIQNA